MAISYESNEQWTSIDPMQMAEIFIYDFQPMNDERQKMSDMYGCISIVADLIKWMTNHKPFKCLVSSFHWKGSYEIQPMVTIAPHMNVDAIEWELKMFIWFCCCTL